MITPLTLEYDTNMLYWFLWVGNDLSIIYGLVGLQLFQFLCLTLPFFEFVITRHLIIFIIIGKIRLISHEYCVISFSGLLRLFFKTKQLIP